MQYFSVKSSSGNCLTLSVYANFEPLQLSTCTGLPAQQFLFASDYRLYSGEGGGTVCVEGESTFLDSIFIYSPDESNELRLGDRVRVSSDGSIYQGLYGTIVPGNSGTGFTDSLLSAYVLMDRSVLDGSSFNTLRVASLEHAPCFCTWTLYADGTFVNNGENMCMTTFDGSTVSLEPCNGGSEQIWSFDQYASIPTPSPIIPTSNAIPSPVFSPVQTPSPIIPPSNALPPEFSYPSFPLQVAPTPTSPTPTSPPPSSDPPILGYLGIVLQAVSIVVGIAEKRQQRPDAQATRDHADTRRQIWIGVVIGFIVGVIFAGVGFGGTA